YTNNLTLSLLVIKIVSPFCACLKVLCPT
ncbi:Phototropin-2, partial [Fusarium oxysporum f. sp. albedinis]